MTGVTVEHRGERSRIRADIVVNAGGMFAPEIARMVGVDVPIVPMAHEYLFTEPIAGVDADPAAAARPRQPRVTSARRSAGCAWAATSATPRRGASTASRPTSTASSWRPTGRASSEIMAGAIRRVPAIADAGINRMINGPEAFTPDNEFILGETEVRGFFVAAGFCAHGIAGAGGIGRQMATWIVEGEPELDLWKMDVRRFGAQYRSRAYTLARTIEVYATYYDIHYPNEERQAGRPLRTSPTYEPLEALGAAFGEKSGWERPNWFESNADAGARRSGPRGWAGPHWSPAIGAEAMATRERPPGCSTRRASPRSRSPVPAPGAPPAPVRERRRPAGRLDRLHAAAQPPRRDRVRPDGHPARRPTVPARDRHRGRQPRPAAGSAATCPTTAASASAT